jgi:rhodanese-related sulfurtransferase
MLRSILGIGKKNKLAHMLSGGAIILDVREPEEFRAGHVEGSLNIPLDALAGEMKNLDKRQPIVTCCRSGARSAAAASLLTKNGFMAHNGGPWTTVQKYLTHP